MSRTLLLCFIHGFKGNDDTFQSFPEDLKNQVSSKLPEHSVETVVYPKYETKGELFQSTERFMSWLKERVMDVRTAQLEKPWPPNDRDVGVILVAHSMGGFVAADALLHLLNERLSFGTSETESPNSPDSPIFPLIQGILTFDTPFNGLARSMFVYGAFSNYQKVSNVFNVMTALSAAPAGLRAMNWKRAITTIPGGSRSNPVAWKGWQLVAVRTGTVGAIAAGGVAAYVHRKKIMEGLRNINKESMKEGYQQGLDALGQGLAYINKGNVGKSFEYLSDHFTFVGSLMKQQELSRRLDRMGALKGVGIHDFYISLGENGMWTGGYFVPERTFCAIPNAEHDAYPLFSRQVITDAEDEIQGHMSMFKRDKNKGYDRMTEEASNLVIKWFNDDSAIIDDPRLASPPPPEPVEEPVETKEDGTEVPKIDALPKEEEIVETQAKEVDMPDIDESPVDIAAAASMVPLPNDSDIEDDEDPETMDAEEKEKRTYMRYLLRVAQQAGTGIKSYVPRQIPDMPQMPSGPSFRSFIPTQMPAMPSVNMFGMKKAPSGTVAKGAGTNPENVETSGQGGGDGLAEAPSSVKQEV